ncbi:MAG TPA: response regulator [Allosphingosinicella sp.]|nr:response regulator [Allosphingosinicella sp.]
MTVATIHVLDDDPGVRRSLRRLLCCAGYEVELYESAHALLAAAPRMSGCVLLDICMPDLDGRIVFERLRESGCPVILMTGHGDVEMAVDVLKSGAADFLEKPFSEQRLCRAIAEALKKTDERLVPDDAYRAARQLAKLTPREREVLQGLVRGEAHKVIAHRLAISARTVELHRARMLQRLGTRHLADAIRLAVLADLASLPAERVLCSQ